MTVALLLERDLGEWIGHEASRLHLRSPAARGESIEERLHLFRHNAGLVQGGDMPAVRQ